MPPYHEDTASYDPPSNRPDTVNNRDWGTWDRPRDDRPTESYRPPMNSGIDNSSIPSGPGPVPRSDGRGSQITNTPIPAATASNIVPLGPRGSTQSKPNEPTAASHPDTPAPSDTQAASRPAQDHLKSVVSDLEDFSTNTVSVSASTLERDAAHRQSSVGGRIPGAENPNQGFPAVGKHVNHTSSRSSEVFGKMDAGLDDALQRHIKERTKLSQAMAAMLRSGVGSNARLENHTTRIDKELQDAKAEIGALKLHFRDVSSPLQLKRNLETSLADNERTHHKVKHLAVSMDRLEDRVNNYADLKYDVNRMREELRSLNPGGRGTGQYSHAPPEPASSRHHPGNQSQMDALRHDLKNVNKYNRELLPRVVKLETEIKNSPSLQESSKIMQDNRKSIKVFSEQLGSLQGSVKAASDTLKVMTSPDKSLEVNSRDFKRLQDLVEGDGGLVHSVAMLEETNEKFREVFQKTDNELEQYDEELAKFGDRLTALESSGKPSEGLTQTNSEPKLEGRISDDLTKLSMDLESFRAEQQVRDDIVTEEVEKISKLAETEIAGFRQKFDEEIARIDNMLSNMQKPTIAASSTEIQPTDQVQPALPNGSSPSLGKPDLVEQLAQSVRRLYQASNDQSAKIKAMENTCEYLKRRLDQASSDELGNNISKRMGEMYPSLRDAQTGYDMMKQKNEELRKRLEEVVEKVVKMGEAGADPSFGQAFDRRIHELESKVEDIGKREGAISSKTPQSHGQELKDDVSSSAFNEKAKGFQELVDRTLRETGEVMKRVDDLNDKVDSVWNHSALEFASLSTQIDTLVEHNDLHVPESLDDEPPVEQERARITASTGDQSTKRKKRDDSLGDAEAKRPRQEEVTSPTS
ncbi:MAG: hypothetical protein M4579_000087 [Chaenotheca gracillima]|nr:MAG: hypothetical protein M4579_000087 [Chaenotheca gracillima]